MTWDTLDEWLIWCAISWNALQERAAHEEASLLYAPVAYDESLCAICGHSLDLVAEDDDCRRNCLECGARRDCTDP